MSDLLRVLKFGGSSVKDLTAIDSCAALVKKQVEQGYKVCVVVSAMGAGTNQLLNLAYGLNSEPPQRELDMLLSTGERVSCALLSIALHKIGLKALSLTGSQSGILTDGIHQNAKLSDIKCERIFASFEKNNVIVIAGFQGVNPETKEITTLGRGGSDLTAVALGVKLKAKDCLIYTDVDGIFTTDPRVCSKAKTVKNISWKTAYTLSCKGAKVLHYRASYLALKNKLPLVILNSQKKNSATTRIEGPSVETEKTNFITYKTNQMLIKIRAKKNNSESLYTDVLSWLWKKDELPALARHEKTSSSGSQISLVIRNNLLQGLTNYLECLKGLDLEFSVDEKDFLVIFIVGQGYSHNVNILEKVNQLSKGESVFLEYNESTITLGLKTSQEKERINSFHQSFVDNL